MFGKAFSEVHPKVLCDLSTSSGTGRFRRTRGWLHAFETRVGVVDSLQVVLAACACRDRLTAVYRESTKRAQDTGAPKIENRSTSAILLWYGQSLMSSFE